jgi:DNA/RNA endonuclease YhcR with UshA esterase domain
MIVASTTQILFAEIGDGSTFSGAYQTLLTAETGMTLYSIQPGGHENQKHLYVVVRSALANIMDAVFKFDFSAGITTKTFADTLWGVHFADGDAISLAIKQGNTSADDILYLTLDKAGAGIDPSGVYAITQLDAVNPTITTAFADPDNNTSSTRGEVSVDYGGNLIYLENSNEQIFVIEPPTTNLSNTIKGIDPVTITSSGVVTPPITIAEAKVDANADGQPDKLNQVVTIIGTVNSVNIQTTGTQYTVQDATGGIALYKAGTIVPFNVGDVLQITGAVAFYSGLTEITPTDITTGIIKLDSNKTVEPVVLSISNYLANGEKYESMLIQLNGVTKTSDSPAWPAPGSNVNLNIWDGKDKLVLRIDKDTQIDDSVEVSWPVNVKGVASQFSAASPYADGYQIIPNFYADLTQKVAVPPSPYFHLATPANNASVEITDSNATLKMTWNKAIDFNNDAVVYQFVLLKSPAYSSTVLSDSVFSYTGKQALGWMGTADTLVTKWTVKAKGAEVTLVSSVDTFSVTFIRKIPVGVNDKLVPDAFYVNQNYPNPFNPSTTISFGLAKESFVDLRVYNVLGQEVAVLISNQIRKAGSQQVKFDASSLSSGTYIYRLKAENQVVTKKMILIK